MSQRQIFDPDYVTRKARKRTIYSKSKIIQMDILRCKICGVACSSVNSRYDHEYFCTGKVSA